MKRLFKFILYFFLFVFILVIILAVVAALSENRIARIALDQVSKTMKIPIEVEDIDFSLLHNFPHATVRCNNVWVGTPGRDTLVAAGRLYVAVEARPLLKQVFNIRNVELEDARLIYHVDTAGKSNIDFIMATGGTEEVVDTSANTIFLDIKDLQLKNVEVDYSDEKMKAGARLLIEQLDLKGLINDKEYRGEAKGKAQLSDCEWGTYDLSQMNSSALDFNVSYQDGLVGIERLHLDIDEDASMLLNGSLTLADKISTEMNLDIERLDLTAAMKYLPDSLIKNLGVKDFSGILTAKGTVAGVLGDSILPAVELSFDLAEASVQYEDYPAVRNLSLSGNATNGSQRNNASTRIQVDELIFQTDKSSVRLNARVNNLNQPDYELSSDLDVDLAEISPFLPDSLVEKLGGKILASIRTKGSVPDSISQHFISSVLANTNMEVQAQDLNLALDKDLDFEHINTELSYRPGELLVKKLSADVPAYKAKINKLVSHIQGDFLKIESLSARIDTLRTEMGESILDVQGTLTNPLNPSYKIKGEIDMDIKDALPYLPKDMVKAASGKIRAQIESAATLDYDSLTANIFPLLFVKSRFKLQLDQVSAQTTDSLTSVENLNAELLSNNDSLSLRQLSAKYMGLNVELKNLTVSNLYHAVLLNTRKELKVHGDVFVDDFDYALIDRFLAEDSTASGNKKENTEPTNFTYKINGRLAANSLKYENAFFRDVRSKFLVKENYYVADSLQLTGFEGSALSSVKIEMQPNNKMELFFRTDLRNMNVVQLMENFGKYIDYDEIKADNVKGIISTKMDGVIVLKDYVPLYDSLMMKGDLTIENGALLNVKPVMEVGKIPGIGIKGLDKLYFSTLNSSLFLFKNELYIPRTEIRSSSFDAMFTGMYSFGEDYAYHIRMFLGEVLTSKSKANLKKQAQDAGFSDDDEKDVTKGRTSIYVVSKSENGKEKAGFDNKRDRVNMVARVNLQQQMVSLIFHPKLVKYETE